MDRRKYTQKTQKEATKKQTDPISKNMQNTETTLNLLVCKNCSYVSIVVQSTALNSSDNLHSYPPDNHHSSDDVYRRGEQQELGPVAPTKLKFKYHLNPEISVN